MEGQILKTNDLLKERLNEYKIASEEVKKTKDFLLKKHERSSTIENDTKFVLRQMKSENMTDENEENIYLQNKEEEEEKKY